MQGELILANSASTVDNYVRSGMYNGSVRTDLNNLKITTGAGFIVSAENRPIKTGTVKAKVALQEKIKYIRANNLANLAIVKDLAQVDMQDTTSNDCLVDSTNPNRLFVAGNSRLRDMTTDTATIVRTNGFA